MYLTKASSSGFFRAISYETDQQRLRLLGQDWIHQEFDNVPIETYHSFPVGEAGTSFYMKSVRGLYALHVLPVSEWNGEPVYFNRRIRSRNLVHWKYDALAMTFWACFAFRQTCTAWTSVPLELVEKIPDGNLAEKFVTEKIAEMFEAHSATCLDCKFSALSAIPDAKGRGTKLKTPTPETDTREV